MAISRAKEGKTKKLYYYALFIHQSVSQSANEHLVEPLLVGKVALKVLRCLVDKANTSFLIDSSLMQTWSAKGNQVCPASVFIFIQPTTQLVHRQLVHTRL